MWGGGYLFANFECANTFGEAQVNLTGVWLQVFGPEWIEEWAAEVGYVFAGVEPAG